MSLMRLDKFLAEAGAGTRSEVKHLIRKKLVSVNGTICSNPDEKVDPEADAIVFKGKPLSCSRFHYYMLNKPAGVVSATEDPRQKTVLDLLGPEAGRNLFPVGRLDKDTEGLLLITDDGALAHQLLSPKKHVDKTYLLTADGTVTADDVKRLEEGVDIGDEKPTLPARAEILESGPVSTLTLTIQEGRYHQVKRMMEAVGKPVLSLKRLSMGSLVLDETLAPGAFRPLTPEELKDLVDGRA